MGVGPGEDLAVSLFADVHYLYSSLSAQPPVHHRFDKESHVYLYENASKRRARIEIDTQTGTPDQDTVDGYLDEIRVQYSFRHPTLISFTIDQVGGREWHLLSFDHKNEQKSKLQSIDIYFWTDKDATQLFNAIRRLLPQEQITILYEPIVTPTQLSYQHTDSVLQKMNKMAIVDSLSFQKQQSNSLSTLPGPPISATPNIHQFFGYTPLAYNPAAPAAPEKISHREKTPPIDDGGFNPLRAAVSSDLCLFSENLSDAVSQNNVMGPHSLHRAKSTHFPSNAQILSTAPSSEAPNPSFSLCSNTSTSNPLTKHQSMLLMGKPMHNSHVPVTQYAIYPTSPGATQIMNNSPDFYSPELSTPVMTPVNNSKYRHTTSEIIKPSFLKSTEYSTNHLDYMVSELEPVPKSSKQFKATVARFEERAARLERGMESFWKKLEKKIG